MSDWDDDLLGDDDENGGAYVGLVPRINLDVSQHALIGYPSFERDERRGDPISQEECERYLEYLSTGHTHQQAANYAGRARMTFFRLRKVNELFDEAVIEAEKMRAQWLEDVSIQQSTLGVLKPVYNKGTLVGYERVFPANPQLQMHVKAGNPDKFRDRSEVHNIDSSAPVRAASEEDRKKLREMTAKLLQSMDEDEDDADVDDLL